MALGQRRRWNWKVRYLTQGDEKMLCPCVEQREITKDHPSWYLMFSPRDAHKSGPGGTNQVLQHVCRNFQGIRQSPRLTSSRYAALEGEVDQPASCLRGHIHGGQKLWRRIYHDASVNLPGGIQQQGVQPPRIPEQPSFHGAYHGTRTSKRKPTKTPTLEPNYDALSENPAPTREGYTGNLSPKDTVRYKKGSYLPRFTTLQEHTKEAP